MYRKQNTFVEYSTVPDEGPVAEFLDEVNDEESGEHEDLPDGQLRLGQDTAQHWTIVPPSEERCSAVKNGAVQ